MAMLFFFFFSSRRRHTRYIGDWSSDVCSSDLVSLRPNAATASGAKSANASLIPSRLRRMSAHESPICRHSRRSEERRVGKEWRARRGAEQKKKRGRMPGEVGTSVGGDIAPDGV